MNENEKRILIVDDTQENIDVLKKTLEKKGYSISIAPSGEVALKIAPKVLPDLILLDVMMPGLNGYETCEKMKTMSGLIDIPVIFVTGKTAIEDIVNGFKVGGVDYVTKPFNHEEVLSRVNAHIELLHAKRKIKQQNEELEKLNSLKNKFLGVASHDLRGALSSIIGYLDLLLSEVLELSEKDKKSFIAQMKDNADRMLEKINNLLDVPSIEKGEINLVMQKNRLIPLIEQLIANQAHLARARKIKIEKAIEEIEPILFDSQRINQVLNCLFSNAINISKENSKILFSLKKLNDRLKIGIGDSGPGFSSEEEEKFFNGKPASISDCINSNKKTGFSLFITGKIIEAHKGQIKSETSPDGIHWVTFTLPLN